jgi:hypothetical protein
MMVHKNQDLLEELTSLASKLNAAKSLSFHSFLNKSRPVLSSAILYKQQPTSSLLSFTR